MRCKPVDKKTLAIIKNDCLHMISVARKDGVRDDDLNSHASPAGLPQTLAMVQEVERSRRKRRTAEKEEK